MVQFSYKARDELGRMVKGIQVAEAEDQLARILKDRNLYLILASPEKEKNGRRRSFGRGKIKRADLIEFSSHMGTILSAGIPILQGLEDLIRQRRGSRFGEILQAVKEDIEAGSLLHEALAVHSQAFGETYIHMIRAGESAGNVDRIFAELARFLEWQEEITSSVKKIAIYPVMVLSAVAVLVLFVFAFAFPRISAILVQMKIPLPLSTRILIRVSQFLSSHLYLVGLLGLGGFALARLLSLAPSQRMFLDQIKLKIPVVGALMRKICLSRFAHHLSLLLEGGIGIVDALEVVEKVVGNQAIAAAIRQARERVQGGATFTEALQASWNFPPLMMRMIAVGESTATLSETLARVSTYYDQEVPATVKKIFSAAEPLLIMFLAAVVLVIALSIYLPIYRSISMIGK